MGAWQAKEDIGGNFMDYMAGDELIQEFRDGIFALRTRRFGTVAEIMVKRLYDLDESGSLAFDKRDRHSNKRIEVKFSTVMKENDDKIRDDNVIETCNKYNMCMSFTGIRLFHH